MVTNLSKRYNGIYYTPPITGTVRYRTHRALYIFKIIRIYLSTEENRDSICGFFTS